MLTQISRGQYMLALASALTISACADDVESISTPSDQIGDTPTNEGDDYSDSDGMTPGDGDFSEGDFDDGSDFDDGTDIDGDVSAATLPYSVDTDYAASGFMGDTKGVVSAPSATNADSTCGGNPAPQANGSVCHTFTYTPSGGDPAWAGVFWQYPANNWSAPGLPIEPGAQKVTFFARANKAIKVDFTAGMDGKGPDGWKVTTQANVGTAWAAYELDLSTVAYDEVAGAFAWAIDSTAQSKSGPFKLFIDGITWTK